MIPGYERSLRCPIDGVKPPRQFGREASAEQSGGKREPRVRYDRNADETRDADTLRDAEVAGEADLDREGDRDIELEAESERPGS